MVRYSGRHSEGKSREDGENNRQRSNSTPSNSSRKIRDNKSCGNNHPGKYWDGREWVLDPNLVKIIENLYDKLETATKSKRELEEYMSCIKSLPSDDLEVAAEAGFEAAFYSAKVEKFKAIQQSVYKKAKAGSRSGSSTDGIEERRLLEATKKETIENKQAWDRDTHSAYKEVKAILEERRKYKVIVRKYQEDLAPIDKKINRMLKKMVEYHDELGHDWFVAAEIPYTLLYDKTGS
ncbi:hypothetical protein BHYA_0027g00560 [Botrytis hyacinthi]|uniref:Uncharacterized protein n=1 Tax=Botrytis hyacinthi TaxID=278943 RepID=A0A4Z1GX41_9HELO|nr:hypothetical protein BHYA_0027g00560 [Botrytis hyacinthi]